MNWAQFNIDQLSIRRILTWTSRQPLLKRASTTLWLQVRAKPFGTTQKQVDSQFPSVSKLVSLRVFLILVAKISQNMNEKQQLASKLASMVPLTECCQNGVQLKLTMRSSITDHTRHRFLDQLRSFFLPKGEASKRLAGFKRRHPLNSSGWKFCLVNFQKTISKSQFQFISWEKFERNMKTKFAAIDVNLPAEAHFRFGSFKRVAGYMHIRVR